MTIHGTRVHIVEEATIVIPSLISSGDQPHHKGRRSPGGFRIGFGGGSGSPIVAAVEVFAKTTADGALLTSRG